MKGSQYYLIACLGVLLICSCANNAKWNDIHTVKVTAAAKAEKKQTVKEQGDTVVAPPYDITVDMEFMDTTYAINAEACKNINNYIINEVLNIHDEQDGQNAVAMFIDNLRSQYEQNDMAPEIYEHLTSKVEFGRDGILNYILNEDYYGGGAHPTQVTTFFCFSTETGKLITIHDVFTDTCTVSLNEVLTDRLMETLGVSSLDSLHSLGYLEFSSMFVSDNFYFGKDSVHFFYNQYDIAPYAMGTTTLSFSYEELKNYLR